MNVFIFSDNVPLPDEVALKRTAREKGLFVMGAGCGNSVINGVSIGLMSRIARGNIGIVGASGSGIHEISMLLDHMGLGISQAIGVGGRDLSGEVGGITMTQGLNYLRDDEATKVIVLVSKPPHPETMGKILGLVRECRKPVVVFFLGGDPNLVREAGAYAPSTLEEAAEMAAKLSRGEEPADTDFIGKCGNELAETAIREKELLSPKQKYVRGLFCGGTHNEEAILMLKGMAPDLHANVRFGNCIFLDNPRVSIGNSLVDMGDEEFTKGRPHPVMDPSILKDRLIKEGTDPEVAVVLFDLLLGYGAHADPVGTIEDALSYIQDKAKAGGRHICLVASLCGTDKDTQGFDNQKQRLEALGVRVLKSNSRAAILSGLIVR